jgi:hypothetical protein
MMHVGCALPKKKWPEPLRMIDKQREIDMSRFLLLLTALAWIGPAVASNKTDVLAVNDSLNALAKKNCLTFDHAEIVKVRSVEITDDAAYVSTILIFAMRNKDGVIEAEKGTWTLVIKKSNGAWRTTGWAWESLGAVKPAKS